MRIAAKNNASQRHDRELEKNSGELVNLWRKARKVQQNLRASFLASDDGQYAYDVHVEIEAIRSRYGQGRLARVPLKVPQGVRSAIIASIADEMSQRVGRTVSPGYIEKCLKDKEAKAMVDELTGCANTET